MNPQGHQSSAGGYERKDADVISLAMIAVMLLLSIGVCLLVCWGILHILSRAQAAHRETRPRVVEEFPKPRLLVDSGNEWERTRACENAKLNSYGWVDRQAGTVRIPVTRAIQVLVERGLPEVGAGQTRLQLMQSRPQTEVQPNEAITGPAPEATP